MLKLTQTPRLAWDEFLMAHADQQQIGHHCNAKGVLDPPLLSTDLVLAQPQVCLSFAIDQLHRPGRVHEQQWQVWVGARLWPEAVTRCSRETSKEGSQAFTEKCPPRCS